MKKFLLCVISLVVLLFIGFTTYYIVRNDESIAYTISDNGTIYLNINEVIDSPVIHKNKAAGSTVEINLSNNCVEYDANTQTFIASKPGSTTIICQPSNMQFSAISFTIKVGNGSVENPFFIRNEEDLKKIGTESYLLSANYELISDIELNQDFEPIGSLSSPFTGSIFGGENMYTISNINIISTSTAAGFFASLGSNAMIERIVFDGVKINGNYKYAGAIAAINSGFIGQCVVKNAEINNNASSGFSGGIVGYNKSNGKDAQISLCTINASVFGKNVVGGICGKNEGGIVHNCFSEINAGLNSTESIFGGIVGESTYSTYKVENLTKYTNAKYINVITVLNSIGSQGNFYTTVARSVVDGSKPTSLTYFDMIICCADTTLSAIGENQNDRNLSADLTSSQNYYQNISSQDLADEQIYKTPKNMADSNNYTAPADSSWDFETYWSVADGKIGINYSACAGSYQPIPDAATFKFELSSTSEVKEALELMRKFPEANLEYKITRSLEIDYDGQTISPIGSKNSPFSGRLDVTSNTRSSNVIYIKNAVIDAKDEEYAGFFGVISGKDSLINNIKFSNITVTGKTVGVIAGLNLMATIDNCTVSSSTINATVSAGGMVGVNEGTIVANGENEDTITSLTINIDEVTSSSFAAGAAVGINNGDFKQIAAVTNKVQLNHDVDKDLYLGGLVGKQDGGKIVDSACFSFTMPEAETKYGGGHHYAGGLAGYVDGGQIDYSYIQAGTLTLSNLDKETYVGGIAGFVGNKAKITRCIVNACTLSGHNVGGVASCVNGRVERCQVNESVMIQGYDVGGLVYQCGGTLTNSYSLATLTGSHYEAGFSTLILSGADVKYNYNYCEYKGAGEAYCETATKIRSKKGGWVFESNIVVGENIQKDKFTTFLFGDAFVTECYQRGYRTKNPIYDAEMVEQQFPLLDGNGNQVVDAAGNPLNYTKFVQKLDENGNPIYKVVQVIKMVPSMIAKLDEEGNYILDENGHAVLEEELDANGEVIYVQAYKPSMVASKVPQLDENGQQVTDENGNVIMVDELDADGNVVLVPEYDSDGLPVYTSEYETYDYVENGEKVYVIAEYGEDIIHKDSKKVKIQLKGTSKGGYVVASLDELYGQPDYTKFSDNGFSSTYWNFITEVDENIINNGAEHYKYLTLKDMPVIPTGE